MAREYGKLYIRAWSNGFTKLPARAQRTYMFLLSQPDISNAGTLTLALRRWANCVGDETAQDIEDDLKYLAARGYVVVDEGCEELLVRTYIKWDGGWRSPNMMVSIKAAASQALSETIRATLREEITKLDTSTLPKKVNERTGRSTKDFIELLIAQLADELAGDEKDPEVAEWGRETLQGTLPLTLSETLPERVSKSNPSRKGSAKGFWKGSSTTTTTAIDSTAIDTTTRVNNREKTANRSYTPQFEQFWSLYPQHRRKEKPRAFTEWQKATRRAEPDEIIAGLKAYLTGDVTYAPYPAKWLKTDSWQDGPDLSRQVEASRSAPAMARRESNLANLQSYISQRQGRQPQPAQKQGRLIGGAA